MAKKKNCWECKFNKKGGILFFGRCSKRIFKTTRTNEISAKIVDKGCYLFKQRKRK